jgi:hypothetical protein
MTASSIPQVHKFMTTKLQDQPPLPCACPEPCQVHLCPVCVVQAAGDVAESTEWLVVRRLVVMHQAPPARHPGRPHPHRCPRPRRR